MTAAPHVGDIAGMLVPGEAPTRPSASPGTWRGSSLRRSMCCLSPKPAALGLGTTYYVLDDVVAEKLHREG